MPRKVEVGVGIELFLIGVSIIFGRVSCVLLLYVR